MMHNILLVYNYFDQIQNNEYKIVHVPGRGGLGKKSGVKMPISIQMK